MKLETRNPKSEIRMLQTGASQAFWTFSFLDLFRISDVESQELFSKLRNCHKRGQRNFRFCGSLCSLVAISAIASRICKLAVLTLLASTLARGQETNLLSQTNAARDVAELVQTNEMASAGELVQTNDLTGSNDLGVAEEIVGRTNTSNLTNGTAQVGGTPDSSRDVRPRADSQRPEKNRVRAQDNAASGAPERPATGAPPPSRNTPAKPEFSSFRLIAERNIFDPNRFPHHITGPRPAPKTVESFALVGIMSYEKGTFAFFDGSSSAYKKALKVADTIAGYKVTNLTPEAVKLAAGTNQVELRVGSQLRREEEGQWTLAKGAEPYTSSATMASSATPAATVAGTAANAADNDVLERLRKKREQE